MNTSTSSIIVTPPSFEILPIEGMVHEQLCLLQQKISDVNDCHKMLFVTYSIYGGINNSVHNSIMEFLESVPKIPIILGYDGSNNRYFITGSISTFIKLFKLFPNNMVLRSIVIHLKQQLLWDIEITEGYCHDVVYVGDEQFNKMSCRFNLRHKYVAVYFSVAKFVAEELISKLVDGLGEYKKIDSELFFIQPIYFLSNSAGYSRWKVNVLRIAEDYFSLARETSPKIAENILLPPSRGVKMIVNCPLPQWVSFFDLYCDKKADESMQEIMIPLRKKFLEMFPKIFKE